jgi:hypothetical protein
MLIVNVFGLPEVVLLCEGADSTTEEQVEKPPRKREIRTI